MQTYTYEVQAVFPGLGDRIAHIQTNARNKPQALAKIARKLASRRVECLRGIRLLKIN